MMMNNINNPTNSEKFKQDKQRRDKININFISAVDHNKKTEEVIKSVNKEKKCCR